jgi:hypothetical protein
VRRLLKEHVTDDARRHITSWTSIELEDGSAPPTAEHIASVMELYPVDERLFQAGPPRFLNSIQFLGAIETLKMLPS